MQKKSAPFTLRKFRPFSIIFAETQCVKQTDRQHMHVQLVESRPHVCLKYKAADLFLRE